MTYAEHYSNHTFAVYPQTVEFLAVVLKATRAGDRVRVLPRDADDAHDLVEGVARHVVRSESEALAFLWTGKDRLRVTSNGWERFIPLEDIEAIEILEDPS